MNLKLLKEHPLPWRCGNVLLWDANERLIDIGRREVRELLVELANRFVGMTEDGNGERGPGATQRAEKADR